MKSLYQMLLDVGYPESQMDHHESDLYIYQTPLTNSVINRWCEVNGYKREAFVSQFCDQITGRMMYDIVFAYDPYWKEVSNA